MNCEACRSLLSGFLDGALAADEAAGVATHLAACARCREELAGLERVNDAIESLAVPVPPRGYLAELQARVRERVGAGEGVAAGEGAKALERVGAGQLATASAAASERARARWWRFAPLAAAALVAVAVLRIADFNEQAVEPEVQNEVSPPDLVAPSRTNEGVGEREALRVAPGEEMTAKFKAPALPPAPAPPPASERNAAQPPSAGDADEISEAAPPGKSAGPLGKSAGSATGNEGATSWGGARHDAETFTDDAHRPRSESNMEAAEPKLEARAQKAGAARGIAEMGAREGAAEMESPALHRAEGLIAVRRFAASRAILDSLLSAAPPVATAARARFLRLAADEAEAGSDPNPETLRALVAGYTRLADEWPETVAGRDAAERAAQLALNLLAETGATADCRTARAQIAVFRERYPEDARADSLAAAEANLPCRP